MFLNCNAIVCAWFYPMLVPLLCIKDNSIGVILANHNQENWTRSTRSFSSHGLIIIPIIWSLILKANYIHFLFRKLPLQKNNSGIWHIYLLLTVPGHKFYLKNNILTISIHEKNAPKDLEKENLYRESILYGGPYLAEDFPPFLPLTLASSSFTGVAPSPPNAACSAASLASLSSSSAFNSSYSFLQFSFVTKL